MLTRHDVTTFTSNGLSAEVPYDQLSTVKGAGFTDFWHLAVSAYSRSWLVAACRRA